MSSPQNSKELFNLRHATARNIAERILGVMKREYPLTTQTPEYDPDTQAKLVCAMGALFNFIRSSPDGISIHSTRQGRRRTFQTVEGAIVEVDEDDDGMPIELGELHGYVSPAEKERADERRDRIAAAMWEDYLAYIGDS